MSLKKNIAAFFIISLGGVLGHFLYKWTSDNFIVGLFFPVNESTWEHLKLLFFPTLIYSAFEYFLSKEKPENYLSAVAISLFCGMFWIVALFYTISGILGYNVDFINIAIYFIGVLIMLCKKKKIIKKELFSASIFFWLFLILLSITAVLFVIFTNNPPSLGIFTPPVM